MNPEWPTSEPNCPLRILFIEDNAADFQLSLMELRRAGLEINPDLVSTPVEFVERIRTKRYEAIVADYKLNGWTGMDALQLMKEAGEDIPFLLLTGALGDTAAVDCIKKGIWNYVLKNNLSRFPVALCRALEEKRSRDEGRQGELALRESEATFRMLAETTTAAVLMFEEGECRYVNHAAELLTGFRREELVNKTFLDFVHPDCRLRMIEKGFPWLPDEHPPSQQELKMLRSDGTERLVEVTVNAVEPARNKTFLVTAFDITERKRVEENVRLQTVVDPLTSLGNYRRLLEAVAAEMERSHRVGRPFSLVLMDLDDLKKINDTLGHLTGSRALCRLANVLRVGSRSIDTPVRYGGDEFALLLPETDFRGAQEVAERIAEQTKNDGIEPPISVSFGIASFPEHGQFFEELFRVADEALYSMKAQAGKGKRLLAVGESNR